MTGNSPLFRHERLEVWRRAQGYARSIRDLRRAFPAEERFGFVSQLRRASGSISHNITEGNGRETVRDKCRFLQIAYGSLLETVSQLSLAVEFDILTFDQVRPLREEAAEIARMITGLRRRYERDGH